MVPIHTKPPCKEYDEGWDRIFKRPDRDSEAAQPASTEPEAEKSPTPSPERDK